MEVDDRLEEEEPADAEGGIRGVRGPEAVGDGALDGDG